MARWWRQPLSGDYHGKEEVLGYLGRLAEMTGGTLKNEPHDVLANDDHVVGLLQSSAARGDKSLHERAAHIVHLRDRQLAECGRSGRTRQPLTSSSPDWAASSSGPVRPAGLARPASQDALGR